MNLEEFIQQIDIICQDYNERRFVPLLETDVVGYLYHLLILRMPDILPNLHLDSRVIGAGKNQKFDLVLGPVERRPSNRPAIQPRMIIEVKIFPEGFTDQQHRVHFEHVLNDDIPKLSQVSCPLKVELLFDAVGYLAGSYYGQKRIDKITQRRSSIDENIIVLATYRQGGALVTRQY